MKLGDACTVRSGLTLRERLRDEGHGMLTVQQGNLSPDGMYNGEAAARLNSASIAPHHLVGSDELVFRSRGPYWSAWAANGISEPLVAIAPLFIVHPTSDIDARYLAWLLGRPSAQRYFASEALGSGVKMVPKSVLLSTPLSIPPLSEQQHIAETAELLAHEQSLQHRLSQLRHSLVSVQLDRRAHEID